MDSCQVPLARSPSVCGRWSRRESIFQASSKYYPSLSANPPNPNQISGASFGLIPQLLLKLSLKHPTPCHFLLIQGKHFLVPPHTRQRKITEGYTKEKPLSMSVFLGEPPRLAAQSWCMPGLVKIRHLPLVPFPVGLNGEDLLISPYCGIATPGSPYYSTHKPRFPSGIFPATDLFKVALLPQVNPSPFLIPGIPCPPHYRGFC